MVEMWELTHEPVAHRSDILTIKLDHCCAGVREVLLCGLYCPVSCILWVYAMAKKLQAERKEMVLYR